MPPRKRFPARWDWCPSVLLSSVCGALCGLFGLLAGVQPPTLLRPGQPPAGGASTGYRKSPYRHDFLRGGAGVRLPGYPSPAGFLGGSPQALRWQRWPRLSAGPGCWWPTLLRAGSARALRWSRWPPAVGPTLLRPDLPGEPQRGNRKGPCSRHYCGQLGRW